MTPKSPSPYTKGLSRQKLARANTFCDALLVAERVYAQLDGLLLRSTEMPFSLSDMSIQFGEFATEKCRKYLAGDFREVSASELQDFCRSRPPRPARLSLLRNDALVAQARQLLLDGLPTLGMDALVCELGRFAGADNPKSYALEGAYSREEIERDPYLRLRVGFTYEDLVTFFRRHLANNWLDGRPVELIVSALVDAFIDRGAIVPTFTFLGDCCSRVYRKGEANPHWDEEVSRLLFALNSLDAADRSQLIEGGRTRVAKIAAILALSGAAPTSLSVAALERGNAAMLPTSVIERQGAELTRLVRQRGLWK